MLYLRINENSLPLFLIFLFFLGFEAMAVIKISGKRYEYGKSNKN